MAPWWNPLAAVLLAGAAGCARAEQAPAQSGEAESAEAGVVDAEGEVPAVARLGPAELATLLPDQVAALEAAWDEIEARPADVGARWRLAALLDRLHREDAAAEAWGQVVALAPENARALHHRGRNLAATGDLDGALLAFQAAEAREPRIAATAWRRGQVLLTLGRLDEADAAFAEAARRDPGDPSGAAGRARVALERDDVDTAERLLEELVRRFPGDGYPPQLLTRVRMRQGRTDEADALALRQELGTRCFTVDPWEEELDEARTGKRARLDRARELLEGGQAAAAEELLAALHASDPEEVTVETLWIHALLALGDTERALAVAEASPHRDTHPRAVMARGAVHHVRGEHAAALACAERALDLTGGLERAHLLRAESLAALERPEEALAAVEELLATGGLPERALVLRGNLAAGLGRLDVALDAYRTATLAYPTSLEAWAGLCELQVFAEDREGARATLERLRAMPGATDVVTFLEPRVVALGGR